MSTKIDFKTVLLIIVAVLVTRYIFSPSDPSVEDVPIVLSPKEGIVEKKIDSIIRDTIYIDRIIPGKRLPAKTKVVVDSLYKVKYENAIKDNDTLKAKNLFLESIALDTYEGTLINNKDIKIDGTFLTRGKLLEYDVTYKIKSDTLTYTPKVITKYPKFSLIGGIEVGLPNPTNGSSGLISAKVGLMNRKGSTVSVGFDSESRITVGYSITLFKTKR